MNVVRRLSADSETHLADHDRQSRDGMRTDPQISGTDTVCQAMWRLRCTVDACCDLRVWVSGDHGVMLVSDTSQTYTCCYNDTYSIVHDVYYGSRFPMHTRTRRTV